MADTELPHYMQASAYSHKTKAMVIASICLLLWGLATPLRAEQSTTPELETQQLETQDLDAQEAEFQAWAENLLSRIDPQSGSIPVAEANVTFEVPESYRFLNATSARVVLEEAWGNPPDDSVLGMLMPADVGLFESNTWGAVITFVDDGYVSDEDAANIDFTDMLADMKSDTAAASKELVSQGYESVELLGWASQPYYDQDLKKLHWAKEMKFGGADENTLNYNIRTLGRKGYLEINFVAGMNQFETINSEIDTVLAMAEFDEGSTYFDFDPDIDDVAAYGIGALVAGKVLAKTGLIAAAIVFLKKFGVIIVVGLGALIARLFKKKSPEDHPDDAGV